jgi:capsid protein
VAIKGRIAGAATIGARRSFQPPHRSGDAAIWDSDDLMARRIRDQARNEPQIKRIRDALEDLIVGGGVQTFADPFDPLMDLSALSDRDVLDGLITYALEADELFEEWFSDPASNSTFPASARARSATHAAGRNVERGGCLLIRTAASGGNRLLPLAYQVCRIRRARPFA